MKKPIKYEAFGFPILLHGVKFKTEGRHKYPDIPHQQLAKVLFIAVLKKPAPLTGAELKFLRKYLDLNQSGFSKLIGVKNHVNIVQWEAKNQGPTLMKQQSELLASIKIVMEHAKREIRFIEYYRDLVKDGLDESQSDLLEINISDVA